MKNHVASRLSAIQKTAIGGTLALASGIASAAIDPAVTTAFTDAKTDIGTLGGLVLVVCVAIFAYRKMSTTTKSS